MPYLFTKPLRMASIGSLKVW